jgi:Flp pilus assembly protein TadD
MTLSWRSSCLVRLAFPVLLVALASCSPYKPFDSAGFLHEQIRQQAGAEVANAVEVPFAIDDKVRMAFRTHIRPGSREETRINQVLDFIFHQLDLSYEMQPTRDAVGTFEARKGNCLSFVNLFVGIARDIRLTPFYVEVLDYQKWNHRQGLVVSQGHIVGGLYFGGTLKTFDFVPYRDKAYRKLKPIDDMTAVAHFYNNLGAEALLAGNISEARRLVGLAASIAPRFPNALNNLGVCLEHSGDREGALDQYHRALAIEPTNTMVMTNMLRIFQQQGRVAEAAELETKVQDSNTGNPFFFVYLGEMALARGDLAKALEHMTQALRLESEVPEVQLGLAKVYLAQGDVERARHFVERAMKMDATDKEVQKYARMLGEIKD